MSETRRFLWSAAKAPRAHVPLALLACALAAAVARRGGRGAAPSRIALDADGGRQTVASTLRAMGARSRTAGSAHTTLAQAPRSRRRPSPRRPTSIVGEGDGSVALTVRLSAPGPSPVSVSYTPSSTAISGHLPATRTTAPAPASPLTFAPGETTKVVSVPILDCTELRPVRDVQVHPAAAHERDDRPGLHADRHRRQRRPLVATPRLFVRDAVVDEKAGSVTSRSLLGGPTGQVSASTVTVDYATSNGTATAGTDYTAASGTLTFAPGETVKNVVVPITRRRHGRAGEELRADPVQPDQRGDLGRHGHRRHRRQRRRPPWPRRPSPPRPT